MALDWNGGKSDIAVCCRELYQGKIIQLRRLKFPSTVQVRQVRGTFWSVGCILFELCTGQKLFDSQSDTTQLTIMEDPIPFIDDFDGSSRKVFGDLICGMICVDVGKRLSMDEFCNRLGDVVSLVNTEFVFPQEQSASPKQFYFDKSNWIGTEIKQVSHSPRIEHLLPTGNTIEDNENLLKRRKTVVNARTRMLGAEHSATRTSIEIYGWTQFFVGDSNQPCRSSVVCSQVRLTAIQGALLKKKLRGENRI